MALLLSEGISSKDLWIQSTEKNILHESMEEYWPDSQVLKAGTRGNGHTLKLQLQLIWLIQILEGKDNIGSLGRDGKRLRSAQAPEEAFVTPCQWPVLSEAWQLAELFPSRCRELKGQAARWGG